MITNPTKTSHRYLRKLLVLPVAAMLITLFSFKYKHRNNAVHEKAMNPVTLVVDAGHGGIDPGVKSTDKKYTESQLTLLLAMEIKRLAGEYNVKVVMTREDDNLPGHLPTINEALKQRIAISEKVKPDAFISLHLNAAEDPALSGFDAYISARKNDPVSKSLADAILQGISGLYKVNDEPVQRHENGVYVLDKNDYPSLLLQCGYITNKNDLAFITKAGNREKIARNILAAIVHYKNEPVAAASRDNEASQEMKEVELAGRLKEFVIADTTHPGADSNFKLLVVIDGVIVENINKIRQNLSADDIRSINILKGPPAIEKYGKKGRSGVIEIETKKKASDNQGELKEVIVQGFPKPVDNKIFQKVEIDAAFPGGEEAWKKYLDKNFNAEVASLNNAPAGRYTVFVQFIVHTDGSISDISALTHYGYGMEEEAIRIIKNSPRWLPAIQNGVNVTAYKRQGFTFESGKLTADGLIEEIIAAARRIYEKQPLIIIDDTEMPLLTVSNLAGKIDPSRISSVFYYKSDLATLRYGTKGRNGVILIKSKRPATG